MNKKTSYTKHNPMHQKVNQGASHKKMGRGSMNLAAEGSDAYKSNYGKKLQPGANSFPRG